MTLYDVRFSTSANGNQNDGVHTYRNA